MRRKNRSKAKYCRDCRASLLVAWWAVLHQPNRLESWPKGSTSGVGRWTETKHCVGGPAWAKILWWITGEKKLDLGKKPPTEPRLSHSVFLQLSILVYTIQAVFQPFYFLFFCFDLWFIIWDASAKRRHLTQGTSQQVAGGSQWTIQTVNNFSKKSLQAVQCHSKVEIHCPKNALDGLTSSITAIDWHMKTM